VCQPPIGTGGTWRDKPPQCGAESAAHRALTEYGDHSSSVPAHAPEIINLGIEIYPTGSGMSVCDPSEMNGDRFSKSSKGTVHSEGGASNATAALHHVYMYENEQWTESWLVDPEAMMTYCKTLYDRISQDREANQNITRIEASPPVTVNALHTILKAISRKDTGGRLTSKSGSNFESMLDLSIALWSMTCSTALFRASAIAVRNSEWSLPAEDRIMRHEGWMFIALVFAWGDVFREASRELIWDYSSAGELSEYLPEKLKGNLQLS
jgi:hypothetical protein